MSAPRIFTAEYYERMRTLEAGSWWNAGMRDVATGLLALADLSRTGCALDVGCGSGQTMAWLAMLLPGWRVIGIDVSADGLRAARAAGQSVSKGSALAIPQMTGSVDLIVCLDVLQHLPLGGGDETALAEARRVLRPGGWLFVRTNAQAVPRTADDPEANFHKYQVGELKAKLERAGFAVRRVSRVNALLGLAEIPRELRAHRSDGNRYHGILAKPETVDGRWDAVKRSWLRCEGRAVRAGVRLPMGRTIVALARAGHTDGKE